MSDRKTIVVIDDDADFLELLNEVLAGEGYDIVALSSGEDAFETIRERAPHLVILDVRLPGVSGFHVLHRLLTEPETAHIPVMVCTGEPFSLRHRERTLTEMGVTVLPKPFDLDTLLDHVARLTSTSAAPGS